MARMGKFCSRQLRNVKNQNKKSFFMKSIIVGFCFILILIIQPRFFFFFFLFEVSRIEVFEHFSTKFLHKIIFEKNFFFLLLKFYLYLRFSFKIMLKCAFSIFPFFFDFCPFYMKCRKKPNNTSTSLCV